MLKQYFSRHWIQYLLAGSLMVMLTVVVSKIGHTDDFLFFGCLLFALINGAMLGKSTFKSKLSVL